MQTWRRQIDARLDVAVGRCVGAPDQLIQAARYSLLAPAKRVRALLVFAAARDRGGDLSKVENCACAIEMIHAASLILDDLPCMDDAVLRRKRLALHRKVGESTAILAAIGLISRGFEVLGRAQHTAPDVATHAVEQLAQAMGFAGLTGGQYDDLTACRGTEDLDVVRRRYMSKTGSLFSAALLFGASVRPLTSAQMTDLWTAGRRIGVGFQMCDDLIDACASPTSAGKDVRADTGKATAVNLLGIEGTIQHANAEVDGALALITPILGPGDTSGLIRWMADSAMSRLDAPAAVAP